MYIRLSVFDALTHRRTDASTQPFDATHFKTKLEGFSGLAGRVDLN